MLKRLEIQCVFKELVKDIVVKGQLSIVEISGSSRLGCSRFCGYAAAVRTIPLGGCTMSENVLYL